MSQNCSRNPGIDDLGKHKFRLILMSKADLADKKVTDQWSRFFKEKGYLVDFSVKGFRYVQFN